MHENEVHEDPWPAGRQPRLHHGQGVHPFYYGGDQTRFAAYYKGKGRIIFTGGNAWGGGRARSCASSTIPAKTATRRRSSAGSARAALGWRSTARRRRRRAAVAWHRGCSTPHALSPGPHGICRVRRDRAHRRPRRPAQRPPDRGHRRPAGRLRVLRVDGVVRPAGPRPREPRRHGAGTSRGHGP